MAFTLFDICLMNMTPLGFWKSNPKINQTSLIDHLIPGMSGVFIDLRDAVDE